MAVFTGGEFLVTGTATSVATALGLTGLDKVHCTQLLLRNDSGAANDAFVGPSTVTTAANRAAQLRAADVYPTILSGPLNLETIFLVGTAAAGNIIHIAVVY